MDCEFCCTNQAGWSCQINLSFCAHIIVLYGQCGEVHPTDMNEYNVRLVRIPMFMHSMSNGDLLFIDNLRCLRKLTRHRAMHTVQGIVLQRKMRNTFIINVIPDSIAFT